MSKRARAKSTHRKASLHFTLATAEDVAELVALHNAVNVHLTKVHGQGQWSGTHTERGVLFGMKHAKVLIAHYRKRIVATLRLVTKKPWAIDISYFTVVQRPLYLLDMAVKPSMQRRDVGRRLLDEAARVAHVWPAQAIRLDAYDSAAGAGEFYAKCGYREVGRVSYRGTPLMYYELVL